MGTYFLISNVTRGVTAPTHRTSSGITCTTVLLATEWLLAGAGSILVGAHTRGSREVQYLVGAHTWG